MAGLRELVKVAELFDLKEDVRFMASGSMPSFNSSIAQCSLPVANMSNDSLKARSPITTQIVSQ